MKYLITGLLLSCFGLTAHAQGTGVAFIEDQSWSEVREQAAEKDMIIFVDAFADWCGPCKAMDDRVFSDIEVGNFFNEHFVNYKLDVETPEGAKIAAGYNLQVIPTYLFVDADGNLVHSGMGYQEKSDLLYLAEVALDPSRNLSGMRERYENGDRSPGFLINYARALVNAADPMGREVVQAYLDTQDDWLNENNMELILQTLQSIEDPTYDFVVKNFDRFTAIFEEDQVFEILEQPLFAALYDPAMGDVVLEKADALYRNVLPGEAANLSLLTRVYFYLTRENWPEYAKYTRQYVNNNIEDLGWGELNEHAWRFYEHIDDEAMLTDALEWARTSVEQYENYYNLDTLAFLYAKLGKKKDAKRVAKAAIEHAKESGDDYSETEKLLNEL